MGAEAKVSYDYNSIYDEISKKLVENEKGSAKGVGQLAKFINDIPETGFDFDKIKGDELQIYPMIVLTDSTFTLFGINYILENKISELLEANDNKKVKHLSLISLDTILLFQDLFNENRINILELLIGYNYDFNQTNSIYKFSNLDDYLIDYINHHQIPSYNVPNMMKNFIKDELME
jgi:hypothetical protein